MTDHHTGPVPLRFCLLTDRHRDRPTRSGGSNPSSDLRHGTLVSPRAEPCCSFRRRWCSPDRPPPTLAGLVKHLASVEREWFQSILDQRPASTVGVRVTDDGWASTRRKPLTTSSRTTSTPVRSPDWWPPGFTLEDAVPMPRLGHVSLRWIYVHMIEETARHMGHADILREQSTAPRASTANRSPRGPELPMSGRVEGALCGGQGGGRRAAECAGSDRGHGLAADAGVPGTVVEPPR